VSSGTCQSSDYYEVSQAQCETAAISLGLGDTSVNATSHAARPPGCIYDSAEDTLLFNLVESSETGCGSGDHSYDCICRVFSSCDASKLLPNAETVGDCYAALPSGDSCTNVAFSGAADCTSTTCLNGVASPGLCAGIACAYCAVV
jgi:hypothetical protein